MGLHEAMSCMHYRYSVIWQYRRIQVQGIESGAKGLWSLNQGQLLHCSGTQIAHLWLAIPSTLNLRNKRKTMCCATAEHAPKQ